MEEELYKTKQIISNRPQQLFIQNECKINLNIVKFKLLHIDS